MRPIIIVEGSTGSSLADQLTCCWSAQLGSLTEHRPDPIRLGSFRQAQCHQSEESSAAKFTPRIEETDIHQRRKCKNCQRWRIRLEESEMAQGRIQMELFRAKKQLAELLLSRQIVSEEYIEHRKGVNLAQAKMPQVSQESITINTETQQRAYKVALQQCKDTIAELRRQNGLLANALRQWQTAYQNVTIEKSSHGRSFMEDVTSILNTSQPRDARKPNVSLKVLDSQQNGATQGSTTSGSGSLVDRLTKTNTNASNKVCAFTYQHRNMENFEDNDKSASPQNKTVENIGPGLTPLWKPRVDTDPSLNPNSSFDKNATKQSFPYS